MKHPILPLALCALVAAATTTCKKDLFDPEKYSAKPTWAIPLAKGSMSVGDLLNAKPSQIRKEFAKIIGGDSVYFLSVVYADTLDPITLPNFANGSAFNAPYPAPNEDMLLEIFSTIKGGTFTLSNPFVRLRFLNGIDMAFTVEFRDGIGGDFYTTDLYSTPNVKRELEIIDAGHPIFVPAGTSTAVGDTVFELTNSNTVIVSGGFSDSAMTFLLEPTPKYLTYGITIDPVDGSLPTGGQLDVVAEVVLPFQGRAYSTVKDTIPYDFGQASEVDNVLNLVDFATLRLAIINYLPLEARLIGGVILDTNSIKSNGKFDTIALLPFYDTNGNFLKTLTLVPAASQENVNDPNTTPDDFTTDISLFRENPITGNNDFETFGKGNAVIFELAFSTPGYDDSPPKDIKLYSNQRIDISLGFRSRLNADASFLIDKEDIPKFLR